MVRDERTGPVCSIPPGCSTLGDNDDIEIVPGFTSRLVVNEGLFHGGARCPAVLGRVAESARPVACQGDGVTIWDRGHSLHLSRSQARIDKKGLRNSG